MKSKYSPRTVDLHDVAAPRSCLRWDKRMRRSIYQILTSRFPHHCTLPDLQDSRKLGTHELDLARYILLTHRSE